MLRCQSGLLRFSSSSSLARFTRTLAVPQRGYRTQYFARQVHDDTKKEKKSRFNPFRKGKPKDAKAKTFYDVLGVHHEATADEIRARYLELAKQHHPDTGGDPQVFAEISSAWKVLGNKNERSNYDQRLRMNPDEEMDASSYEGALSDRTLRVILSTGFLKFGPMLVPLPRAVLIPLIWVGVEQVEGDTPVYRRFYKLGLWWTLFIIFALRQLYVTYRDWNRYEHPHVDAVKLKDNDRSRFAWRLIGLSIALASLPLLRRRMNFLSLRMDFEERLPDAIVRIIPTVTVWLLAWTYTMKPLGSVLEWLYLLTSRKEVEWSSPAWDVVEHNASRILQGVGSATAIAWSVARQNSHGVPVRMCGRAATMGLVGGRFFAWLLSFALVGRKRRAYVKEDPVERDNKKKLAIAAAAAAAAGVTVASTEEQVAKLQQEVEELREALTHQTPPKASPLTTLMTPQQQQPPPAKQQQKKEQQKEKPSPTPQEPQKEQVVQPKEQEKEQAKETPEKGKENSKEQPPRT